MCQLHNNTSRASVVFPWPWNLGSLYNISVEWLGYCAVQKLWQCVKPFQYNTRKWRTDRLKMLHNSLQCYCNCKIKELRYRILHIICIILAVFPKVIRKYQSKWMTAYGEWRRAQLQGFFTVSTQQCCIIPDWFQSGSKLAALNLVTWTFFITQVVYWLIQTECSCTDTGEALLTVCILLLRSHLWSDGSFKIY